MISDLQLPNKCLITVDPGKASGWGTINLSDPLNKFKFGEYPFMEMNEALDRWSKDVLQYTDPLVIVCERFTIFEDTITKSRGSTNWSIETIGVARYIAHRDGHEFVLQGATEAKGLGTDKLLRRFGWWTVGSDHARDAARHAVLYIAKNDKKLFDLMLKETEE